MCDPFVTIAFCTTTFRRNYQIQETLPRNLQRFRRWFDTGEGRRLSVYFVVVDFNPDDELKNWVCGEFAEDLASGLLRYFHAPHTITHWHAALCKNTAHVAAGDEADVLMNLDNDQFMFPQKAHAMGEFFSTAAASMAVVHDWSGDLNDGTFGRVSLTRKAFFHCGGYAEDGGLVCCGAEDRDIMDRCTALGYGVMRWVLSPSEVGLQNTKQEGIRHVDMPPSLGSFEELDEYNQARSRENIANRRWVANVGRTPGVEMARVKRVRTYGGELYDTAQCTNSSSPGTSPREIHPIESAQK